MTIDAIAGEPHFLAHLAPVWHALPARLRGTFHAPSPYHARARELGIEPVDMSEIVKPRRTTFALTASYGDTKRARKAGYLRQAFLEHGIGQSYAGVDAGVSRNGSYAGGVDRGDTELFLVPNERAAARWRASYPDAQVEVVGCPKLDGLPRKDRDGDPVIAVTFHWDCTLVPETEPALQDFAGALPLLARRYQVIGHAHPRFQPIMERHYQRWGIPFVPDFEEVCRRADLLIFDNTSAGYEFAATGRPVVLMNAHGYRKHVNHGLRFWEAATVGPQVDPPGASWRPAAAEAALVDAIETALSDGPEAREAALDIVYPIRTGAAQRAAGLLVEWVSSPAAVAA